MACRDTSWDTKNPQFKKKKNILFLLDLFFLVITDLWTLKSSRSNEGKSGHEIYHFVLYIACGGMIFTKILSPEKIMLLLLHRP